MSKFNPPSSGTHTIVNHEGATAYSMTPKMELYSLVCTSMLSGKFYESESDQLTRMRKLIHQCSPHFVAQLAIYAREQMYLRSVPLVLICELTNMAASRVVVAKATERVIQRADEITEILACFQSMFPREKLNKLPSQFKKGIGAAFNKFDEYQFGKYDRKQTIRLVDAMRLCHPKPSTDEQSVLLGKIKTGTLATPYTWETELSALGTQEFESAEAKTTAFRDKWTELLESTRLGYMALLRNLSNILSAGVGQKHIALAAERLADRHYVLRSKQLPFRFYTAYCQLAGHESPHTGLLLSALNEAIWKSVENLPLFNCEDTVLIAADVSGSMCNNPITPSIDMSELGLLMAILLRRKVSSATLGLFAGEWDIHQIPQHANILESMMQLRRHIGGGATNAHNITTWLNAQPHNFNKVCIFTDMQFWNTATRETAREHDWQHDSGFVNGWKQYHANHPDAELYLFDLQGYGQAPLNIVSEHNAYLIAGWSDKIFGLIDALRDGESVIGHIESIEI